MGSNPISVFNNKSLNKFININKNYLKRNTKYTITIIRVLELVDRTSLSFVDINHKRSNRFSDMIIDISLTITKLIKVYVIYLNFYIIQKGGIV